MDRKALQKRDLKEQKLTRKQLGILITYTKLSHHETSI
jgi:hypothetical protein